MISMDKTYKYRNGEPAHIICVNRPTSKPDGPYPVVSTDPYDRLITHMANGRQFPVNNSQWDLIEVKPTIMVSAQLYVYRDDRGRITICLNHSKEDTKRYEDYDYEIVGIIDIHQEIQDGHGLYTGEPTKGGTI